mgnify:CR=1 FL=1
MLRTSILAVLLISAAAANAPPPPPASGPSQLDLDNALKAYFVDTWTSQTQSNGALWTTEITYRADGSFVGVQNVSIGGGTTTNPITGSYTLKAIDSTRFTLSLWPQGLQESSSLLEIVDTNTLFNRQANYYATRVVKR